MRGGNLKSKMARKKFLRSKWRKYSKLGRGRRKKQKYRKAKGRHNKMREKMKGNPVRVSIGYKKSRKGREKELIIRIFHIKGLEKIDKNAKIFISKIGKKKKIEIVKKAKSLGLKFENLSIGKFLKKIEREQEKKKKEGGIKAKEIERKKEEEIKKEKKKEPEKEETKEEKK